MDNMNIVLQCNDKFAMLAGTVMLSICENNREEKLNFYILNNGIMEQNIKKLFTISDRYSCNLEIIPIKAYIDKIREMGLSPYGGVYGIYMKAFLGDCFSEDIHKLLYLDCDIIINGKIRSLWNIDLGRYSMGIAIDCMNSQLKIGYGIDQKCKYYNTGVILYDLRNWRKNGAKEKFIDFVKMNHKDYLYADQDYINICLQDEIFTLPMRYNYLSIYSAYKYKDIKYVYGLDDDSFYSCKEYKEAGKKPVIIHYTSVFLGRPWHRNCLAKETVIFEKYLYHEYNPWNDYKKVTAAISFIGKCQRLLYSVLPYVFFVRIQKYASILNTKYVLKKLTASDK